MITLLLMVKLGYVKTDYNNVVFTWYKCLQLQLIAAVARIMSCGHDLETTKTAIKTLHHLSHHEQGLLSICRSGAIDALVKLLR